MKKNLLLTLVTVAAMTIITACGGPSSNYSFETVKGDPMKTRIYTLDNGLKVYLTDNDEAPRITAYIPVRVGGKNDPDETTGLAHYFEHLMFKGTTHFGTQNYELEKPLLDQIEQLFEVYRTTADDAERKAIYHRIDSISYEASKIAIPNEYDKLMAAIGASGTNAFTSYDVTCYTEDIPANELENWAKVQSDRFANAIIRGFHTELETVYEEKNMSLTDDSDKAIEAIFATLFKKHPYGTHTVLGTQDHLKNPSITNIKNYYKEWYVPNNMAICMSGDLDFDQTIEIIDRYFGSLQPNDNLKKMEFATEEPITAPIEKEITGLEAEQTYISWRVPGENDFAAADKLTLIQSILSNGTAGLFDLNVNQEQKVLTSGAGYYGLADYGMFFAIAYPKQGQTLEEAKDVMLEQFDHLRKGEFDESLIAASLANYKLEVQRMLEKNNSRVRLMVNTFVNGVDWVNEVKKIERMETLTKQDIIDFANQYLKEDNYVVLYKRQGKPEDIKKMDKPQITPIFANRDTASEFLKEIQENEPAPIEPVFIDFQKDITHSTAGKLPVLYKENKLNDIFTLIYRFDTGSDRNKVLPIAAQFIDYLGTADMSNTLIKQAFYNLACEYNIRTNGDLTSITISGLAENMPQAIALTEKLIREAQSDAQKFENLKADIIKGRAIEKAAQSINSLRLFDYVRYGAKNPSTDILSAEAIAKLTGDEVLQQLRNLYNYEHEVLYYGPAKPEEVTAVIEKEHTTPDNLLAFDKTSPYTIQQTTEDIVYLAPYDANQVYMRCYFNDGQKYDPTLVPITDMYNEYFGGGMNGIVFQEMREARGLAYSAAARQITPVRLDKPFTYITFIATQNDKTVDALQAFDEIINRMPESQKAFDIAKKSLLTNLRTQRITGINVLQSYVNARLLGLDYDIRKNNFDALQNITLADIVKYQQETVKDRHYSRGILGRESDLDMKSIAKYGKVVRLTTEDIFGY